MSLLRVRRGQEGLTLALLALIALWALALLLSLSGGPAFAQAQTPKPDTSGMGSNASAGAHTAVFDAQRRPITAGGFVDSGPIYFEDITKSSGLATWKHTMGTPEKKLIIETDGSGVGLIDYDNDGWLDIYLVNGSTFKAYDGKEQAPQAALFHNNRDGTFTNVAEKAGVTNGRWGFGVAVADYDNDGWPDIFVTNYGKNRLYHNNHDGTFTDVAEKAGVTLGGWSAGATFGDYDGDGRLDLFVSGYVHYDMSAPPLPGSSAVAFPVCRFRGIDVMCGPRGLKGDRDHLFHNNGDGTFTDVSEKAGVSDPRAYYGFTSVFVDLNNDGKVDLLVANDSTPNYLYLNKGDGTFEDVSYESGYALNQDGRETATMGIGVGDWQNTGWVGMVDTDFSDDWKVVYRNEGDANFSDVSYQVGIADITLPFVGWGAGLFDFDNDGWKDMFLVNGHVYPDVDNHGWGTTFAERPLLFKNIKGQKFDYVAPVRGSGLAVVVPGRGAAFGDLFNDGKIDVVISVMDAAPVLLKNVKDDAHHWVELKLIGGPKSPRDAVGATVYLKANGIRQREDVMSGGSYISSNDQRPHFGIGDATRVDELEIRWPSRVVEKLKLPSIDRIFTIEEGRGIVAETCAKCAPTTNKSKVAAN